MCDYQDSVTTGQTDTQTDGQMPDKVIPTCCYASQATQKVFLQTESFQQTIMHLQITDKFCHSDVLYLLVHDCITYKLANCYNIIKTEIRQLINKIT